MGLEIIIGQLMNNLSAEMVNINETVVKVIEMLKNREKNFKEADILKKRTIINGPYPRKFVFDGETFRTGFFWESYRTTSLLLAVWGIFPPIPCGAMTASSCVPRGVPPNQRVRTTLLLSPPVN